MFFDVTRSELADIFGEDRLATLPATAFPPSTADTGGARLLQTVGVPTGTLSLREPDEDSGRLPLVQDVVDTQGFEDASEDGGEWPVIGAARREVMPSVEHRSHKGLNNRAENSHQPTRQRERAMKGFRSVGAAQRFLSAFSGISSHFRPRRHLMNRSRLSSRDGHPLRDLGPGNRPARSGLSNRPGAGLDHASTHSQALRTNNVTTPAAEHPTLAAYCRTVGTPPSTMTVQLQHLERDLQGQLLIRG